MNAIDEILLSIQLFFETYGWYILLAFLSLWAVSSSKRVRQIGNDLSMRAANDPERRRVLDEDRKRVRDAQQAKLRETVMAREKEKETKKSSAASSSDCEGRGYTEKEEQLPKKKVLTSLSKKPSNSSSNPTSNGYNPLMGGGGVSGFRPSGEMRSRGNRGG